MKKLLLLVSTLVLFGCYDKDLDNNVSVVKSGEYIATFNDTTSNDNTVLLKIKDPKSPVTCYALIGYRKGGLSCIPDNQIPSMDDCVPSTVVEGKDGMPGSCVPYRHLYTEFR